MDLHRYAAFRRLWRRSPPLQVMVQAYLGIEGEEPAPLHPRGPLTAAEEDEAIDAFAQHFAAAGGLVH